MKISIAQINPTVGDFSGNVALLIEQIQQAKQQGSDLLLLPEMVLTGYPAEDLWQRPGFITQEHTHLQQILPHVSGITVVMGASHALTDNTNTEHLYNAAYVLEEGKIKQVYHKQCLPNYSVFDEKRYFSEGSGHGEYHGQFEVAGEVCAVLICEDLWQDGPLETLAATASATESSALNVLVLNASPYHQHKKAMRHELLAQKSLKNAVNLYYCNIVGGQDELVFDGSSSVYNALGQRVLQMPSFKSAHAQLDTQALVPKSDAGEDTELNLNAEIYQALVLGLRDYMSKNDFKSALLGLSGGIDSALTLAIAVDALGAENLTAVMMPYTYTSQMSLDDAAAQANSLGVSYMQLPIEGIYQAFETALAEPFSGLDKDTTEENLQARIRGNLLMAMSNKTGKMLLTTGNKSEISVGYATLYGDMSGGFSPLKDVYKTRVYELARYRNQLAEVQQQPQVVPQRVIEREPSAELAPDQKDTDSLPDYAVLDDILWQFNEQRHSTQVIIDSGHDADEVKRVIRLLLINEYKRRQGAPGIRISQMVFGRDRRYPISSKYRHHL